MMLISQSTARAAVYNCRKQHGSRRVLISPAQQHDRESFARKAAPVLLSAGLALSLLLATPIAAEARVKANLKQQREEQERLYAEQIKRLDAILQQQIREKKAGGAKYVDEAQKGAVGSAGKQSS